MQWRAKKTVLSGSAMTVKRPLTLSMTRELSIEPGHMAVIYYAVVLIDGRFESSRMCCYPCYEQSQPVLF
jgi:hypothetical protein